MSASNIEATDFNKTKNYGHEDASHIHFTIAACCAFVLCLFGMLGNGIAFWFLCFKIKRNKYTVYIINLTIADFTYLFFNAIVMLLQMNQLIGFHPHFPDMDKVVLSLEIFYDGAYHAGMFFLMAISIERCLSVFYPIWYRCQRPKHQSVIVCLILWVIACLATFLENLICSPESFSVGSLKCTGVQTMTFVLLIGISLPLMLLSSTILLIKIQKMSKRCRPPKLYIIIIITVFIFLIATVPIKFMWLFMYLKLLPSDFHTLSFFFASVLCTVFSSSINPYIYFLVGRQRKQRLRDSIHSALHSAFNVEEDEAEKSSADSATYAHSSVISYVKT
ncbi:hypothetical protein FKM82_024603 [Ascaphus truei]